MECPFTPAYTKAVARIVFYWIAVSPSSVCLAPRLGKTRRDPSLIFFQMLSFL